jgi:hypothetical protein
MHVTITRDRQELEQLEDIIRKGQQTFYEVGRALMKIRDGELYKINGYEPERSECARRYV